ncbi:DUF2336 domain-containing protein [Oceanicaulis sp. UBA6590]|uniref:DUF2336 domain-containing protein n=1 Tax=Oceanicaulis sp. UBA6590 TaxID=1947008 RepID=UPI0025FB13FD|nr:DUF2336 domain-containing protein [Oceanicaulis sp. UBA6590]|tara:strand:+ start:2829 stop:3875 length:1047 start_codon:yes stop_codon:yes gene_type:complete
MLRSTSDPLAGRPPPSERAGQKALALADLCTLRALPEPVLCEIDAHLTGFLRAAEARVRARAAIRLAECPWAPVEAIRSLAFDAFEIASPVLQHSERLKEQDLLALAALGPQQRLALARRNTISEKLAERLCSFGERDCLEKLFRNLGAKLNARCAEQTADLIKADCLLREALSGRGALEVEFARSLYEIAGDAVYALLDDICPQALPRLAGLDARPDAVDLDALGETLSHQLHEIEALNAEDVLRATQNGRTDIADHAVARLTGLEPADWRQTLRRSPVRVAILAARAMAMSIDHAHLFYAALCEQGRAHPLPVESAKRAVGELYQQYSRDAARQALHRMSADGSIH